jgi:putative peptidoglycan lipid II flippase
VADDRAERKERSEEGTSGGPEALDGRRLGAAALLLAGSVLLSRVLGFVREMVLAAQIGAGSQTDAYYAAFLVPDILNYLLAGGALAIAFTPLYQRSLAQGGEAAASRLFHTVLGTMTAIVVFATLVLWTGAEQLTELQFPGFDDETRALTTRLARIVLPAQIFFITGGIMRAVLMAHGRFLAQAAAPVIYNFGIIVGGVVTGTVEGFAWGALGGAIVGTWLYPLLDLRKVGPVGLRVAPWDPEFRVYLWTALPLMLGVSLTTVDEWYEKWFGATVGIGVVATLGFARRLMMAPVAVIGQAVAAAALPTLSALHASGRQDELDRTLLRTLQATLVLAVFAAAGVFVFAEPFVNVMYRRGAFTPEDARTVATLLAILAWAVPGWVLQQVAVRAFFARGDTWRPMMLGTAIALGVIPLYLELARGYGGPGLAAAGVVAISVNAVATLGWSRVRFGGPSPGALLTTGAHAVLLCVPAALVGSWVQPGRPGNAGALLDLAVGGGAFVIVGMLALRFAGNEVMRETARGLTQRITARLRRSRGPIE